METETTVGFSEVKKYYIDYSIIRVHGYRTESHHWVEMSEGSCGPQNEVSAEEGIKLALSQGATEVALMLKDEQSNDTYPVTFSIYELGKDKWSVMLNKAMARKLRKGDAVDISNCPTTKEGYYMLDDFFEDKDYCDAVKEVWILSIGVNYATGQVLASTSSNLYQNPEFECIFLR
jgi:hypothetical protein